MGVEEHKGELNEVIMSMSSDYRRLQRSHSVPHIASRHDSSTSGMTATTNTGTASCSLLDHIDYDSALSNEHPFNHQTHHYNKTKNHNYHHHNHHQQQHQHQHYDNVSENRHSVYLIVAHFIHAIFIAHPSIHELTQYVFCARCMLCILHTIPSFNVHCVRCACLVCWSSKLKKDFLLNVLNFLLCIIHYTSKSRCSRRFKVR